MNEIGEELQYARESSGVSLNEASKDLGIKVEILENIEDGRTGAFKDIFELKEYISNYVRLKKPKKRLKTHMPPITGN